MEVEEFLKEAAVMKEIKHPNLVQLLGMYFKRALVLLDEFQRSDPILNRTKKNIDQTYKLFLIQDLFWQSLQMYSCLQVKYPSVAAFKQFLRFFLHKS